MGVLAEFNFNARCEELLAQSKRRNAQKLTDRLETLCGFLQQRGNHVVQTKYGGSVQKGTYVTGLSDVDVLLIVNESSLLNQTPGKVKEYVRETIKQRFSGNSVRAGKLAVTVTYADGMEIQLLPAIRTRTDGVRIARPGARKWSNVAHPDRFVDKLTKVNAARNGRAVPTIRLAKMVAGNFSSLRGPRISGYHMESLAIDAFQGYQGPLDPKTMLIHLLRHSMEAVKTPIVDRTGQSRYVDQYLGRANSEARKRASKDLGQMWSKVNSCKTRKAFNALFGIGG